MEISMGNKFHRNPVQIPSTTQARLDEAFAELKNRELLYNRGKKELGIKIDDELIIPKPRVDEFNVTYNEDDEIALKDDITVDSVTARADREGVDWKSQTVLAETTEERTIILICVKDNDRETGMVGFFGGEIVELGEDVESHYQVSLTSTGSRLIKGATTNKKKAKPCFVKYNGDYYYGIHFKESSPAKIYHAGWSNIPGPLAAPSYTTYTDGDFSEIVDLDDDSETGTELIEFNFSSIDDYSWEFIERTSRISPNFRNSWSWRGSGTNRRIEFDSHLILYQNRFNNNNVNFVELHPEWGSFMLAGKDVTLMRFDITDEQGYISITAKNWAGQNRNNVYFDNQGVNIVVYGSNASGEPIYTTLQNHYFPAGTSTYEFGPFPKGTYWLRQGSGGYTTGMEYYVVQVDNYGAPEGLDSDDLYNYDLGNNLRIKTHNEIRYIDSLNNNLGILQCTEATNQVESEGLAQVDVFGPCTFTVGFSRVEDDEAPSVSVLISESLEAGDPAWARAVQAQSYDSDVITTLSYTYNGTWGKRQTLYIATDRPVNWYNASLDYPTYNSGAIIADIIRGLDETGEDGSPHIIRPSGTIDKASLMTIAGVCLNSERQLVIDLSNCTAAANAQDWSGDSDLSKLFQGASSINKFIYPKGVTTAGSAPFLNCSFLRDIEFNDEMYQLGYSEWVNRNQGFFSGARIKEVWLPKQLGQRTGVHAWGGYFMAQNNVLALYIRPDSYYAQNNVNIADMFTNQDWNGVAHMFWSTWNYSRGDFKIYLPCKRIGSPEDNRWETSTDWLYNRWRNQIGNTTFGAVMNEYLSSVTNNVPSLERTDLVRDHLAPYDVNEMWYEPRGLDPV